MKTVLWISRHDMTPEQFADLERIMGAQVCLHLWRDTVGDVACLASALREADAVAAVLPPELLSGLLRLAGRKPVFIAVSGRIPTGRTAESASGRPEPEFAFVHRCWRQLLRLEIETRTL